MLGGRGIGVKYRRLGELAGQLAADSLFQGVGC
jgi:hypothetical protein